MKIGLVVAMDGELKNVIDYNKCELLEGEPFKVYKIVGLQNECYAIISGIGKINAAMATTYIVLKYQVEKVVNFGVCGATLDAFLQDKVVCIDKVFNNDFDLSAIDGDGWQKNNLCLATENDSSKFPLYTADHFTVSSDVSGYFDMEGFAVASVCDNLGISCELLKSVTDIIDSKKQSQEYYCNYDSACNLLKTEIEKII